MNCWFAALDDRPCDGPVDRCHLIPKQRIKRELQGGNPIDITAAVWHPSAWVFGCRLHHANFDNGGLRVQRHHLPPAVEHFAMVMEMEWSLDCDFGRP